MTERHWSKPRRLALESFFVNGGRARRSNATSAKHRLVYWQSVDWLAREGLVERASIDDYRLTRAGWEAGRMLWNVPQPTIDRMIAKAS